MKSCRRLMQPILAVVLLCLICIAPESAPGAGFALIEQSASGLGNAFAGGAAVADDASAIFFNPAGLIRLERREFVAAAHLIIPQAEFENKGSTHMLQPITGVPLLGDDGRDAGVVAAVPNAYYSHPLSERLVIGIGLNAPFGLSTEYDPTWVGRYHAINSEVFTANINPSVAYKVSEQFSVGFGLNIQYIHAELSNAIDYGSLDAAGVFAPLGIPAGALGLTPQGSDGLVKLEGGNWGFGFNGGILYSFTPSTRVGIAYRSRIEHNLDGDATFTDVPAGLASAPLFKKSSIEAEISLPDSASASLFHQINDRWAVMADVTWTNWSLFDELRVKFDNEFQDDAVTTTDWDDNFRYAVGLTYAPNTALLIRCGAAFDETPIPSAEVRTPRIPGEDRVWVAAGLGYRASEQLAFDLAYAHLFVDDAEIDKQLEGENLSRGGLKGTYDSSVDIMSVQLTWRF